MSIDGDREAFHAAVRWYTLRDIAILTALYGLILTVFIWRKRRI
jgi:hypothetical protein